MVSGCAAGGGYVYADGVGYYQPAGYNYGGWGPNYTVGPVRADDHRDDHRPPEHNGGPPPQHEEHGAAPRPVPSIPSGPRSGESHPH